MSQGTVLHSLRFARPISLTLHARQRMADRGLDEALITELVESGEVRYKDATHVWIARSFEGREDNLVCVAAVLEDSVVIKTVMHHFAWESES